MGTKDFNLILGIIIFSCVVLLVAQNFNSITGHSTVSTPSNVSIQKYLAISFSENLALGINFGNVEVLPATDINSTNNYNGVDNSTTLYINVSEDGNVNTDFCIRADVDLTNADADIIGLGNETYSNSTNSNLTDPSVGNQVSLTTSYVQSGTSVSSGGQNFYRFFLDIPAAQPSGTYNNSISFKAIETGTGC